jgi:hypothetical protein
MNNVYHQQSKLLQTWFWITYIPVILLLLINFSKPGERGVGNIVFTLLLVTLPLLLLLSLRFRFVVDAAQITYQYFPLQLTSRTLSWSEVESAQLIFFDPVKHYWGYGYRKSAKYGTVYSTKGNVGLLVKTKDQQVLNFEIINQAAFSQFVKENQINTINLDIINIEHAVANVSLLKA